ncbi:MAG: hypothetical protein AB7G48_14765 [Nitrospiraceae bacterium]
MSLKKQGKTSCAHGKVVETTGSHKNLAPIEVVLTPVDWKKRGRSPNAIEDMGNLSVTSWDEPHTNHTHGSPTDPDPVPANKETRSAVAV